MFVGLKNGHVPNFNPSMMDAQSFTDVGRIFKTGLTEQDKQRLASDFPKEKVEAIENIISNLRVLIS